MLDKTKKNFTKRLTFLFVREVMMIRKKERKKERSTGGKKRTHFANRARDKISDVVRFSKITAAFEYVAPHGDLSWYVRPIEARIDEPPVCPSEQQPFEVKRPKNGAKNI